MQFIKAAWRITFCGLAFVPAMASAGRHDARPLLTLVAHVRQELKQLKKTYNENI